MAEYINNSYQQSDLQSVSSILLSKKKGLQVQNLNSFKLKAIPKKQQKLCENKNLSILINQQQKKFSSEQIILNLQNKNKNLNSQMQIQKYYNFFNNIIPSENYQIELIQQENFNKHKIKLLNGNQFHKRLCSYHHPFIRVKYTQQLGSIVVYTVIISMFQLQITLLNIDQDAKEDDSSIKIGQGTFGSVRLESQNKRIFAVKRQTFQNKDHLDQFNMMSNKYQINQIIIQLAIYKICSLFKIGPAVQTQIGFDLICYRDCIQFQFQYCLKIEYKTEIYVDESKFQKQIKQCLIKLHLLQIIHKDIKPANILYSKTYNKYILSDFGTSQCIAQQIGQASKTYFQGTEEYMSDQMKKLSQNSIGFVHLYGNDVHSLSIVLNKQKINQKIEQSLKLFNIKSTAKLKKSNYYYEYLKLKYFCIKPNHHINNLSVYWKCMDHKRRIELISIVSRSMDYEKISRVYNQLSKLKQFESYNLYRLMMQATSIKQITLYAETQQKMENRELYLKNHLRAYGYSQQIKTIIRKLQLQKKYPKIMKILNKIQENQYQLNKRELLLDGDNYFFRYVKKLKNQYQRYQRVNNIEEIFKICILLLKYCKPTEIHEVITNLKNLKYERTKKQQIYEKILINYRTTNKQHLQIFLNQFKIQDDSIIQQLKLNNYLGQIYYQLDKYEIALDYYVKAQQQQIQLYRQQTPHLAYIYKNMGLVYIKQNKYKQALNYFNISLIIEIRLFGQYHPKVAQIYSNIADIYFIKRNYQAALSFYIKSLNINIKYFGQQHINVSNLYQNIALIYQRLCKYKLSLHYYNKILEIFFMVYGQNHFNIALTYNNIGAIHTKIGNYIEALEYLTKSLNIAREYNEKQNHANIYTNIGEVYTIMGEYENALNYLNKSLNINIQCFGRKHPTVASNYDNLAKYYLKIGKYQDALEILQKNILTWSQLQGQQSINIAITYNAIGNAYKSKGEQQVAFNYYQKALKIDTLQYGLQHPNIAVTKNQIGLIYCNQGKYDEALANFLKSIEIYIIFNDSQIANVYNNIGVLYFNKGEYQIAINYYKKSIALYIQYYGQQQNQELTGIYINIGRCQFILGQFSKAHLYTYKALKIRKKNLQPQYPEFQQAYYLLFDIFSLKKENKKSILYLNMALQIFLKYRSENHRQYYNYLYSLSKILYKTKKYLESYFIYKLIQKLFDQEGNNTQNQKQIKKVKKSIRLIQKMNQLYLDHYRLNHGSLIILKERYVKLSNLQLLKILQTKKLLLKIQEKYIRYTKSSLFLIIQRHIQCMIQIWLCYKYLKYKSEYQKAFRQLQDYLQQVIQTQRKQKLCRYLKQVID